jgi:hypothetical protein
MSGLLAGGHQVTAADLAMLPSTDTQNASGTTTSGSFTATLSGGTACGVTFVAPPSGKVMVFNCMEIANSSGSYSYGGFQVRAGGSIGSGTVFLAVSVDTAVNANTADLRTQSRPVLVTGLTSGSTYNVQQLFARDANTLTALRKSLTVIPQLA